MKGYEMVKTTHGKFRMILSIAVLLSVLPLFMLTQVTGNDRDQIVPLDIEDQRLVFSSKEPTMIRTSVDEIGRMDMVWVDSRDSNKEIYYLKVGVEGWKLHNDMRITNTLGNSTIPCVASTRNGTATIVFAENGGDDYTLKMSSLIYDGKDMELLVDGLVLREGISISNYPVLKRNIHGNAILLWGEQEQAGYNINMMVLDPFADVAPDIIEVYSDLGMVGDLDLELIGDGNWSLVWNGQYGSKAITDPNFGLYFSIFDETGSVLLDPVRKSITGNDTKPDIEYVDERVITVFSSDRYSHSGVIFTSFDLEGRDLVDDVPITEYDWICYDPSIRKDPEGNLSLTWWDKGKGWSIYRSKVDPSGDGAMLEEPYPLTLSSYRIPGGPQQIVDSNGNLVLPYVEQDRNGIDLIRRQRPDLEIEEVWIWTSGDEPILDERMKFNIEIENSWPYPINRIPIIVKIISGEEITYDLDIIKDLEPASKQAAVFFWTPSRTGDHKIEVQIDPENELIEKNETNNLYSLHFTVSTQSFEVSSETEMEEYSPGARGKSSVTITNTGGSYLYLNITLKGDNSHWFETIYGYTDISPGGSTSIEFKFQIPENMKAGKYLVLVDVRSSREKMDLTLSDHQITVSKVFENNVDFINYKRDVDPGRDHRIAFKLRNDGNSPMEYSVSGSNDLNLTLLVSEKELPLTVGPVEPGKEMEVGIDFFVPITMLPGTIIEIDISIEGIEGGQTFSSTYNLTVKELPVLVFNVVNGTEQEIPEDWEPFDVMINITNTGNSRDIFDLRISTQPNNWMVDIIDPFGGDIALSPDENGTVMVHVSPMDIPEAGSHRFIIEAIPTLRGDLRYTQDFNIVVGERYGVEMSSKEGVLTPSFDAKNRILVSFTNTGNQDAQYIIDMKGPGTKNAVMEPMDGKKVAINETKPFSVQARGTYTFYLEFELPSDLEEDTIIINVTCFDDTTINDEMIITMEVPGKTDHTTIMLIAGTVLVLALLIILFMTTRFLISRRESSRKDLLEEALDDEDEI
jgi:uncharacterized membrane protein